MPSEPAFHGSSLCVVGNINRDLKVGSLQPSNDLFRDGETSVSSMVESIGGGGANSACAAASLGARVSFVGKVGADALGGRLERTLQQHGIESHLRREDGHPSGTSVALGFAGGERHFISCLPASRTLCLADIDLEAVGRCRHLLRADVWFSESMLFEGNQALFESARRRGMVVSIDLNWDPQWNSGNAAVIRARKQAVRAVLPSVTVAHGNVRELMEFSDAKDLPAALALLTGWGVESVVVHRGGEGAGHYQDGTWVEEPPAPVTRARQSTGTGDVLSVCMMLLHGHRDISIRDRLRLANRIVAEFIEGKRGMIPPLAD